MLAVVYDPEAAGVTYIETGNFYRDESRAGLEAAEDA